jgi:hypothetical protein
MPGRQIQDSEIRKIRMGTTKYTVINLLMLTFRLPTCNCAGQVSEGNGREMMGEEKAKKNNMMEQRENREAK